MSDHNRDRRQTAYSDPRTPLDPIAVDEALDLYLDACRDRGNAPSTLKKKELTLDRFLTYCEDEEIDVTTDIGGRDVFKYEQWRFDDHAVKTRDTELSHLRDFFHFCVRIEAVPPRLPDAVEAPDYDEAEQARDTFVGPETARDILQHLANYEYGSLAHVLVLLGWETGARVSGLHSLDLDDVDTDENHVAYVHRPEQGTRLKNKQKGERVATLDARAVQIIEDYISHKRRSRTDEYGRTPLFTSRTGRMSKKQLSRRFYYWTVPCHIGKSCPSGNDPSSCEYEGTFHGSLDCPHSHRPHDLRRGSIMMWLNRSAPKWAVSERADVSEKTLDTNYDARTHEERAEVRRDYFD